MLELKSNVKIVPLSIKHANKTAEWVMNPVISENIGLRSEPSLEKTIDWISQSLNNSTIYPFAIEAGEVHVGNVVLDRYDAYLAMARFSIYIGESKEHNRKVGKTATYQICKYGFENLSLRKIWLTVHSRNFPAINTYTSIGFELEGLLREEFLLNEKPVSALYMGLLKKDFERLEVCFI